MINYRVLMNSSVTRDNKSWYKFVRVFIIIRLTILRVHIKAAVPGIWWILLVLVLFFSKPCIWDVF